ncbi:hypothetical protein [Mesorhizobium sp. M0938]
MTTLIHFPASQHFSQEIPQAPNFAGNQVFHAENKKPAEKESDGQ